MVSDNFGNRCLSRILLVLKDRELWVFLTYATWIVSLFGYGLFVVLTNQTIGR